MAFSVTVLSYPAYQAKGLRHRVIEFAVSTSDTYPSGGYPITAAMVKLTTDSKFYVRGPQAAGTTAFLWVWDMANQKLRAYKVGSAGGLTECSSTDCQSVTGYAEVVGY